MRFTDIEDLRRHARRRVPKAIFDYVDGGSYTEAALRNNRTDLDRIRIVQRVLSDVTDRSQACPIFGETLSMPILISPTGLAGLVHPNGEVDAYRAATAAGTRYTLCTPSISATDDLALARAPDAPPFWFQIYVMKDRGFTEFLLDRARRAGCRTLVITLDLVVNAQRHRDTKNGLAIPFRITPQTALDALLKPGWFMRMTRSKRRSFGNFEGYPGLEGGVQSMAAWVAEQYQPLLTDESIGWIRDSWEGPVILKGIMTPEDARKAVDFGADAIIVSNHGGRQLDAAPSPVSALPAIADAIKGEIPILADSGVRTGADVFRMIALGADACMIGRAHLYGLGAAGQAGVERALEILRDELDVAMALAGCRTLADIDTGTVIAAPG